MSDPRLDISRLVRPLFQVETLLCRPRLGVLLRTCAVKQFAHTHTHFGVRPAEPTWNIQRCVPLRRLDFLRHNGRMEFLGWPRVTWQNWSLSIGFSLTCLSSTARQTWVLRLRHKANIDGGIWPKRRGTTVKQPETSMCMSLFFPDRTVRVGNRTQSKSFWVHRKAGPDTLHQESNSFGHTSCSGFRSLLETWRLGSNKRRDEQNV